MIYALKLKQQPLALTNLSSKLFDYKFAKIKSIRWEIGSLGKNQEIFFSLKFSLDRFNIQA